MTGVFNPETGTFDEQRVQRWGYDESGNHLNPGQGAFNPETGTFDAISNAPVNMQSLTSVGSMADLNAMLAQGPGAGGPADRPLADKIAGLGYSAIDPNASAGVGGLTQAQLAAKSNPGGSVVTGSDGKSYWKINPGSWQDAGFGGSQGSFLSGLMTSPVGIGLMMAGGAGLAGAFSGAGAAEAGAMGAEGFGAGEATADFGTNAFEFGGTTGTTPLTGGGGFSSTLGSSFQSAVQSLMGGNSSGISPSNLLRLVQAGGKMASSDTNSTMFPTTGAPGGSGTLIPGLLSAGSGLFDLFSQSPYSSQGMVNSAADVADPIRNDRAGYAGMLKSLMTDPASFALTPAAQTQMKLGTENLTRSDAAKGLLGSGNILGDIMKYGEGVASADYWKQIDQLDLVSGAKTGSPPAAGQIMTGALPARNNALSNIGGALGTSSISSLLSKLFNGGVNPASYTAGGDGGIASGPLGYPGGTIPGDANMPGDLANATAPAGDVGSFEDLFNFA